MIFKLGTKPSKCWQVNLTQVVKSENKLMRNNLIIKIPDSQSKAGEQQPDLSDSSEGLKSQTSSNVFSAARREKSSRPSLWTRAEAESHIIAKRKQTKQTTVVLSLNVGGVQCQRNAGDQSRDKEGRTSWTKTLDFSLNVSGGLHNKFTMFLSDVCLSVSVCLCVCVCEEILVF